MAKCAKCGDSLRHVHRTFLQHFTYMAVYRCRQCQDERVVLRHYLYHFGEYSRCPCCGTFKVTRLKQRDKIDPMAGGFLNLLERIFGGNRLYHCRFCRAQFYDHREVTPPGLAAAEILEPVAVKAAAAGPAAQSVPEADSVPGPESAIPKS